MLRSYRKVAIAVGAMAAGFGSLRGASAAPVLIENDESAIVDGWNITAPAGVALTVTTSGNTIDIEKAANFTGPYESLQVAFQPVAGASGPATSIDFTNETILDNTGSPFNGFSFLLLNIGGVNATFSGDIFVNAIGPTPGSLDGALDSLAYVGTQADGATSSWGDTTKTDDLYISAPAGSAFTLDEVPSLGGGVVPIPAAAWQSLVGLAGLGVVGTVRRRLKLRRLA
jgi:hypothetical protein